MDASSPVAIVTGGARGIGAAIAQRLAADGLKVGIVDLQESSGHGVVEAITDVGGTAVAVGADVSQARDVSHAVDQIASTLGAPTVLVNNAGITRDNLLFKMSEADWTSVLDIHLRGAFLMTKAVQKFMVDAGWGRIINLSSTSALGNRGQSNYAAAKAGMQGLTKTLAIELGKFGITANAVAPGFIQTEMTRATAERLGRDFDEFSAERAKSIAVGRPGRPEDVAALVSYFVRDEASFVSGQVVYVAGGPRA